MIDHGLGVQSLYGHLSSIGVRVGDKVEKGQEIGRSGQTGLAGGDHLHFTTLVGGEQVTPVDWWSTQWIRTASSEKLRLPAAPLIPRSPLWDNQGLGVDTVCNPGFIASSRAVPLPSPPLVR